MIEKYYIFLKNDIREESNEDDEEAEKIDGNVRQFEF